MSGEEGWSVGNCVLSRMSKSHSEPMKFETDLLTFRPDKADSRPPLCTSPAAAPQAVRRSSNVDQAHLKSATQVKCEKHLLNPGNPCMKNEKEKRSRPSTKVAALPIHIHHSAALSSYAPPIGLGPNTLSFSARSAIFAYLGFFLIFFSVMSAPDRAIHCLNVLSSSAF